uniref:Putative microtubule-associated tumor suppressor 1 log isoform 1 n=1 Tax=Desmodus rotundus TaxID=9430 RepID=K9IFS3_DESRO
MTVPGGFRSCTETDISANILINSTLTPPAGSERHYDATLLTLLVLGSYSLCVGPLLATLTGSRSTSVISGLILFFVSMLLILLTKSS